MTVETLMRLAKMAGDLESHRISSQILAKGGHVAGAENLRRQVDDTAARIAADRGVVMTALSNVDDEALTAQLRLAGVDQSVVDKLTAKAAASEGLSSFLKGRIQPESASARVSAKCSLAAQALGCTIGISILGGPILGAAAAIYAADTVADC